MIENMTEKGCEIMKEWCISVPSRIIRVQVRSSGPGGAGSSVLYLDHPGLREEHPKIMNPKNFAHQII